MHPMSHGGNDVTGVIQDGMPVIAFHQVPSWRVSNQSGLLIFRWRWNPQNSPTQILQIRWQM